MNNTKQAIILFADSNRGTTIPKHFAESVNRDLVHGIDGDVLDWFEDVDTDAESYWDEWETVIDNAIIKVNGHDYKMHHDGDLWLYCEELMTEQEKLEFFGE